MIALLRCYTNHPRWTFHQPFGIATCAWCQAEQGSRRHP